MTEETGKVEQVAPEATPEATQVSSTQMTDNGGLLTVGGDEGKVTDIPMESTQSKWEDAQKWFWRAGIEGEGKRPEWADEKYDNVEEQAKANNAAQKYIGELKNKLGTFADWKAPESYDFSADMQLNEGDPNYNNFVDLLRTHNVPQDFASKMMGFYKADKLKDQVDVEQEIKSLGPNWEEQKTSIKKWAIGNYSSETAECILEVFKTAKHIKALKEIRASMTQATVPTGVDTAPPPQTEEALQKDFSDNLYKGKNIAADPDLQQEYIKKFQEFV